jgi:branched-chain amino acid transport system ATP-binding protein
MEILNVENLTMKFGSLAAVDDVSLSVRKGEIIGLIGPNGAGKTTFFNCLTGYLTPQNGAVQFDGHPITGLRPNRICRFGLTRTFQIVQVFREMKIWENVIVGAFCRTANSAEAYRETMEILKFTGLYEKKDSLVGNLTIADHKRLEISKALATKPHLLMLDEAMAGLNATETIEAVELIKKIRDRGITLIVVEHVMEVIMSISERVVVFDSGKKIAEDTPEKIVKTLGSSRPIWGRLTMLEVKKICVSYLGVPVIREVSFKVEEGQMVSIVGSNGAGKSTLLKTISGLLRPLSGEIIFLGKRIDTVPPYEITSGGISHIPEGRKIFAKLSVLDNLLVGAHTRDSKSEVQQSLEEIYTLFPFSRKERTSGEKPCRAENSRCWPSPGGSCPSPSS